MYIPKSFAVTDPAILYPFMQANNFAALVSPHEGATVATHLPLLIDSERGILSGHFARANPQWKSLDGTQEALVIFQGAHTYISPSWYEQMPSVPTWNYTIVHAYGTPRLIHEAARLRPLLVALVDYHEGGFDAAWDMAVLDAHEGYMDKMMAAIVGFEMPINRLEGKFKLSQNRTTGDQAGVIAALLASDAPQDRAVAGLMAETDQQS
jgi:transcriptional regulator